MASTPPPPKTLPSMSFADALHHRRSVYALNDTLPSSINDSTLQSLIKDTLLHTPSAFNSQTTRIVLLLRAHHKKFWSLAGSVMKSKYDPEKWERTSKRLAGFEKAAGSVLFFEDQDPIREMQNKTPNYAHLFPGWSEHTSGMHQLVIWMGLEAFEGVGCNLQHYHYEGGVEEEVRKEWSLPGSWEMKAQLVFGGVEGGGFPNEGKTKKSTEETLKVFGAEGDAGAQTGSRVREDGTMERRS